jgi:glycosyltransferase involved in cell wall biosynthesis
MKIAFFGQSGFLDYFRIGGFQSFVRRIAGELAVSGDEVDYVIYSAKENREQVISPNLRCRYFRGFPEAVTSLPGRYDRVIKVWLRRSDRLSFIFFCRKFLAPSAYHYLCLIYPESGLKRRFIAMEAGLSLKEGKFICVSPRQLLEFGKSIKNCVYLLPPVPHSFFLEPSAKPQNHPLRVRFIGMLTADKFIEEIIDIFTSLEDRNDLDFCIYAIHDPENKKSLQVHNRLKHSSRIRYVDIGNQGFTPETDESVRQALKETDIFIQPYRTLVNTLDMPLLLLEAMASLCAVVTTPLGSIAQVYGESKFTVSSDNFKEDAKKLLEGIDYADLLAERQRLWQRNKELKFDAGNSARQFKSFLA